jgi:hypothetical protein
MFRWWWKKIDVFVALGLFAIDDVLQCIQDEMKTLRLRIFLSTVLHEEHGVTDTLFSLWVSMERYHFVGQ